MEEEQKKVEEPKNTSKEKQKKVKKVKKVSLDSSEKKSILPRTAVKGLINGFVAYRSFTNFYFFSDSCFCNLACR